MKYSRLLIFTFLLLTYSVLEVFSQVAPTLISPQNGDNCVKKNVRFEWSEVPYAVSYRIEIADEPTFESPLVSLKDLTTTSTTISLPSWNNTYYWRAVSVFANNNLGISAANTFKTKRPPLDLLLPVNGSVCNDTLVTFKWKKVEAEFYHLQVSESITFDTLIYNKDNLTDTSANVKLPKYSKTYYWRVASIKSLCKTEFSEVWSLTTKQAPPTLLYPTNNAFGGDLFVSEPFKINFIWKRANSNDKYDFQLSKTSNFDDIILNLQNFSDTTTSFILDTKFDSTYYWRVRVISESCVSYWSPILKFKSPYAKPELATPLANETCITMNQTLFRWSIVPNAVKYRLQVSDTITFTKLIIDSANINDRQIHIDLKKPITTHYWRVRAEDSHNNGLWSETRVFITTQKAPSIIQPINGSIGLRKQIDFNWENYGEGVEYDLKLYADSELSTILLDTAGLDTNYFHFVVPNDNKVYYWKVRAKFGVCYSDWSGINTFKTLIPAPQLISPEDKATRVSLLPIYQWSEVEEAENYEIEISLDSLINKKLIYERNLKSTTWTNPGFQYAENTKYYWRVRAVNNDGVSVWSDIFSFTTDILPPKATTLIYPPNSEVKISHNPTLIWSQVDRAVSYIVTISTDRDFENIFLNQATPDTTIELAGLERYTYYWWKVKTVDVNSEGTDSETYIFRTEDIKPEDPTILVLPQDKAKNTPLIINFSWNKVERALLYHLQISEDNTFATDKLFTEYKTIPDTQRTVIDFKYGKTYFWRVVAWNEAGNGEWSQVREFSTPLNSSVRDNDINISNHFVSPNPVTNTLNLTINALQNSKSIFKIADINGNIVFQSNNIEINQGENTFSFDVHNLITGFYFYYLESKSGTINGKIIVE